MRIKRLIKGCRKGDTKAQEKLYRLFAPQLFAVSLKYCKNYQEAEDNLQESFLTIFNKIDQYGFRGSFEGWLKRITINTALQSYRKQPVFEIMDDAAIENPEEVDVAVDSISIDFLLSCIQELPTQYRHVFSLYVLDGYSHKEISALLQIAEGTSKSNLARARRLLKEKITQKTSSHQVKNTKR